MISWEVYDLAVEHMVGGVLPSGVSIFGQIFLINGVGSSTRELLNIFFFAISSVASLAHRVVNRFLPPAFLVFFHLGQVQGAKTH